MTFLGVFTAICALALALFCAARLERFVALEPPGGRVMTLDGLRGIAAFCVYIHHANLNYAFYHDGRWMVEGHSRMEFFGRGSVAAFFMLTAFLFFSKILDAKERPIDWLRLYVSRFLRIVPLYLVLLVTMMLIIAVMSHGQLQVTWLELLRQLWDWTAFTMPGQVNINGVADTFVIVAGVTWTLPYEWAFYFCLPILALLVWRKVCVGALAFGLIMLGLWAFNWLEFNVHNCYPFVGGFIAAFLVRSASLRAFSQTIWATGLIILFITLALIPKDAMKISALICLTGVFVLMAGGNRFFGLLTAQATRVLGEISYSIYLLHGLVLTLFLRFALGPKFVAGMTPWAYWACIFALVPLLIGLCCLTFRFIERPALAQTKAVAAFLRIK